MAHWFIVYTNLRKLFTFTPMSENKLYHISYVSTGCDGLRYEHIKEILESSNKNNETDEISGILIYCNKHFFQIIEGEKEKVEELFQKIAVDPRHDNVIKLQSGFIEQRHFETWNMGFKSYNKELKPLDDFNNEEFYSYVKSQMNGHPAVSLKILVDFFDLNG
jgi:hypothetical protein